ncbi:hypothetical protein D9Q98_001003 [Chlorella vulgaris]|uniref:CCHC-type domain-containing protein n=1 Tax=Chlorella vulgaris TaxID=3077 RepID=A0A9D4Z1Q7_CHLVU|nr:hypothetical protein D9Q98_001003 [Chlorella vulgaris]
MSTDVSSSSSGSDADAAGHPIDAAIRGRQSSGGGAVTSGAQQGSPPESGEVPGGHLAPAALQQRWVDSGYNLAIHKRQGRHTSGSEAVRPALRDLDDELASAGDDSAADRSDDQDLSETARAPAGVVLVESTEEHNAEVQRLLRAPRYFDEDFEEAGLRCFKCGGKGHFARDCSAEAKERSCFLCSQFGHDSRDCPSSMCWRCQRPGHLARDCPYGYRQQASWDEGATLVCLRCGSGSCPCAGEKDVVRAEGGCKGHYAQHDLQLVRCYSCGRRGHLNCATTPIQPAKLSCANCGQGGHNAGDCARELPQVMRGERINARPAASQPDYGTNRGRSSYSSGYDGGAGHTKFPNYSGYAAGGPDFSYRGGGGFKRPRR